MQAEECHDVRAVRVDRLRQWRRVHARDRPRHVVPNVPVTAILGDQLGYP